jgi:hypothetical protein
MAAQSSRGSLVLYVGSPPKEKRWRRKGGREEKRWQRRKGGRYRFERRKGGRYRFGR